VLPVLLEKNYREQNDVDPKQTLSEAGLFIDTIRANENFMITPGALIFHYVPYEIGPYAAGEIVIYIPFGEIEFYLKPEMKKLLRSR
jgi:soluble P-type ATPase